jgi:hypothetical protein
MAETKETMATKRRRSPQDKKALSYKKDRRNSYGENAKASRNAIPRHKALSNRAIRRSANRALRDQGQDDSDNVAQAMSVKRWRKVPDAQLGETVKRKLSRRVAAYRSKILRRLVRIRT